MSFAPMATPTEMYCILKKFSHIDCKPRLQHCIPGKLYNKFLSSNQSVGGGHYDIRKKHNIKFSEKIGEGQ